jgi:putative FmdB family regulatory protein
MPTYEFGCLQCGHTFTTVWNVAEYEEALRKGLRCPNCNGEKVEQKLSARVQTSKKS